MCACAFGVGSICVSACTMACCAMLRLRVAFVCRALRDGLCRWLLSGPPAFLLAVVTHWTLPSPWVGVAAVRLWMTMLSFAHGASVRWWEAGVGGGLPCRPRLLSASY
jgi:hypothetical protein